MTDGINLNLFGKTVKGLEQFDFKKVDLNGDGKITKSDTDLNHDGEVTQEELDYFKTFYGFSFDDLSLADCNNNGEISSNEYIIATVKSYIQEKLDSYKDQILAMSVYSDEEKQAIADKLMQTASDFYNNYNGKVSQMKAAFIAEMENVYNQIEAQYNETVYRKKFDEAAEIAFNSKEMQDLLIEKGLDTPEKRQRLAQKYFSLVVNDSGLRDAATSMSVSELAQALVYKLCEKDTDIMSGSIGAAKEIGDTVGNVISDNDAQLLRGAISNILEQALSNGIVLNLNGTKITTEKAAENFLNTCNFYDKSKYDKLIQNIKDQLSPDELIDKLIKEFLVDEEIKKEEIFEELKADDFKLTQYNTDLADIYGNEYYSNAFRYTEVTWGITKSKEAANSNAQTGIRNMAMDDLNKLKPSVIENAKKMLLDKGFTEDQLPKVLSMLDNVFVESAEEACKEVIEIKEAAFLVNAYCHYNLKDLVDKFFEIYNSKIGAAISEINLSRVDIDKQGFDYSNAGQGCSEVKTNTAAMFGGSTTYNVQDMIDTGKTATYSTNKGIDDPIVQNWIEQASKMLENMKNQYKTSAQTMCRANGIEFDEQVFETLFKAAAGASIEGCFNGDKEGAASKWLTGLGITSTVMSGGVTAISGETGSSTGSLIGALGLMLAVPGGLLASIVNIVAVNTKKSLTFDPRDVLNTMTENFIGFYTVWVNSVKSTS